MKRAASSDADAGSGAGTGGGGGGGGGGGAGGGSSSASSACIRSVRARQSSPLIEVLEAGLSASPPQIVKVALGTGVVYTGFAKWHDLARSNCAFQPMNTNRAISDAVVKQRVSSNLEHFARHGCYCEFGQINLLILRSDPSAVFFIMDGQHRVRTMEELHAIAPDKAITFQFRAKVVQTEVDAHEELLHYQNSYPADPRSFFSTTHENRFAAALLERLYAHCSPQLMKVGTNLCATSWRTSLTASSF